jgi:hypothetical protein
VLARLKRGKIFPTTWSSEGEAKDGDEFDLNTALSVLGLFNWGINLNIPNLLYLYGCAN